MAELVDALASGASVRKDVEVQVLSRAPRNYSRLNQATFIFERSNSDKQKSPVSEGFSRAVSARMVSALRTARVCGHP